MIFANNYEELAIEKGEPYVYNQDTPYKTLGIAALYYVSLFYGLSLVRLYSIGSSSLLVEACLAGSYSIEVISSNVHKDDIMGLQVSNNGATPAANGLEACFLIARYTSLIIGIDAKHNIEKIEVSKRIIQEKTQGFSAEPLPPMSLVSYDDADFRRAVDSINVHEATAADEPVGGGVDDAIVVILAYRREDVPLLLKRQ